MIICLSLNPSLDKTLSVSKFTLDAPNRVRIERADVSGKAVNVACAVHALGEEVTLIGFDYENAPIADTMTKAGIGYELRTLRGKLRTNLKLRDLSAGRTIEINEAGCEAGQADIAAVRESLLRYAAPGNYAALSGSLPPGVPKSIYRDLCAELKKGGCFVAVDCDGEALKLALEARPDLIKPNEQEFAALTGADMTDEAAVFAALDQIHARGIGIVCLSLGPKGALLSVNGKRLYCPAADVTPLSVAGAGDNMLAALLTALNRHMDYGAALRFASAASGAAIMRPGTQPCQMDDVTRLMGDLRVIEK